MDIFVNYSHYVNSSDYSDEPYGEWYEQNSYVFTSLSLLDGTEKVTIKGDPKVGDILFLVYALYGTGDSFGHASGRLEIIGVYDELEKATDIKRLIEDDYRDFGDDYSSRLFDADGLPVNTSTWKGYFESLEDVVIEILEVIE